MSNEKLYNRLNPLHWIVAFFSNSRKNQYLIPGTLHVDHTKTKATQRILYWFRNPAHDFMSYIIGFEQDPEFKTVKGNDKDTLIDGWIFALRKWKFIYLPYIAYQGKIQFYFGWRPNGNFGIKLRRTPK